MMSKKCINLGFYFSSPWRAMRQLGEKFGYYIPVTPLTGRVECHSGDRKTCIWTLHSTNISK